jgi:hypothetical protein
MAEIERTIGDFVNVHHRSLDPQFPPIDGPRALLKMRLAAAAQQSRRLHWWNLNFSLYPTGLASIRVMTLFLVFAATVGYRRAAEFPASGNSNSEPLPNRGFTPGATRPVRISEICAMKHDEVRLPVSDALQKQVFQEYGLRKASADNYEVDFLIAPGLGGTNDIRSLARAALQHRVEFICQRPVGGLPPSNGLCG